MCRALKPKLAFLFSLTRSKRGTHEAEFYGVYSTLTCNVCSKGRKPSAFARNRKYVCLFDWNALRIGQMQLQRG